jgi:putative copper export protein
MATRSAGPLRQMSRAAILVVFLTTVGWLLLAGGEMGVGWAETLDPATIGSVLFDTEFRQVWLWRLGFAVVLLGVLAFSRCSSASAFSNRRWRRQFLWPSIDAACQWRHVDREVDIRLTRI